MRKAACLSVLVVLTFACVAPTTVSPSPPPTQPIHPCGSLDLSTQLPNSPSSATVFWQRPSDVALDADRATSIADTLDVTGPLTSYVGESGAEAFVISDGEREVTIFSDRPLAFTYSANSQPLTGAPPSTIYPHAQLVARSQEFLRIRGLLDFVYRIEETVGANAEAYSVRVIPVLDGLPLFENDPMNPRIWLVFDGEGDVWKLFYETLQLADLGDRAIVSAEEVWRQVCQAASPIDILHITYNRRGQIASSQGMLPIPGQDHMPVNLSSEAGHVEAVELAYYAFDLRFASRSAYLPDSPARLVQPVWRFAGHDPDGLAFDILVSALTQGSIDSLAPPS